MKPFLFSFILLLALTTSCHNKAVTTTKPLWADTAIAVSNNDTIDSYADVNEDSLLNAEVDKLLAKYDTRSGSTVFTDSLEIPGSVIGQIQTYINAGPIFHKAGRHVFIRQISGNGVNIKILQKDKTGYKQLVNYEISALEHTGDTLKDVNSDGFNDLLIHTYGSSGCCLKAFCELYLYKPDGSGFAEPYRFDNPTFSPSEKVVRGVYYGYAGLTPMYKYCFNGMALDTVETVSIDTISKRYILQRYPENKHKPVLLKEPPAEYRNIFGFYWFMGDI